MKKLVPHGDGGHTTRQTTAWCCTCPHWEQVDGTGKDATDSFRRSGWRKTAAGWQCRGCRRQEAAE